MCLFSSLGIFVGGFPSTSKPFIKKPKIFILVLVLRIFIILKVCWLCPSLWNVERVSSGFPKQVRKRAVFICLWQVQHSFCFCCCQAVLSWLTKACLLFHQSSLLLGLCCFPPGLLLIAQATDIPWPRNEAWKILCQELFVFLVKPLLLVTIQL